MAYNPSQQLPISKGLAPTGGFPVNGKYEFYDATLFVYRPYVSVAEIGTHIGSIFRRKGDTFLVNTGGTLNESTGVITGGTNSEYWYKDDTTTPVAKGGGGGSISTLTDVTLTSLTNGQILVWNSGSSKWINANPPSGSTALSTLSDVTISSPSNGQALIYNSGTGKWVNGSATSSDNLDTVTSRGASTSNPVTLTNLEVLISMEIPEKSGGTPTANVWEIYVAV